MLCVSYYHDCRLLAHFFRIPSYSARVLTNQMKGCMICRVLVATRMRNPWSLPECHMGPADDVRMWQVAESLSGFETQTTGKLTIWPKGACSIEYYGRTVRATGRQSLHYCKVCSHCGGKVSQVRGQMLDVSFSDVPHTVRKCN